MGQEQEGRRVGVYLSDRLFVAIAKKVGFPTKRTLQSYRDLQLEFLSSGCPITLFTLTRLKGVLDAVQTNQFVGWAREVIRSRPSFSSDLRDVHSAEMTSVFDEDDEDDEVVEVVAQWTPQGTMDFEVVSASEVIDLNQDLPQDHTEELMRLLDEADGTGGSASGPRFESDDMLPLLIDEEEKDSPSADDCLAVFENDTRSDLQAVTEASSDDLFGDDFQDDLFETRNPPSIQPVLQGQDSALFDVVDWDAKSEELAIVDPWADPAPPTRAAPESFLGPTTATASAEFTGSFNEVLDDVVPQNLYETLASKSDPERLGLDSVAPPPPPPPPMAPLLHHSSAA